MKSRTTTYAVALGLASTLALAGCNGGDNDPNGTPTPTSSSANPSTSATTSASPSASSSSPKPSSVPVPSAAKLHSQLGAVEYAKWYVRSADHAFVALDALAVRDGAKPDCVRCVAIALGVEEAAKQQARQTIPAITIEKAFAAEAPEPNPDQYFVDVQTAERAVDVVGPDGAVVNKTSAGKRTWRMNLDWTNGTWLVSTLEVL